MAKGKGGGTVGTVEALVTPVLEQLGMRLWDVRFEKEGSEWFLKVLIDRDEPLDTDTCEKATRAIDPILDEADPIDHSYILEVGSPGLGRKLSRRTHFEAMAGRKVRAGLYRADAEGRKELAGTLLEKTEDALVLETEDGVLELPAKEVAGVWLCDDEDLFS